jgi:hypothetical protein
LPVFLAVFEGQILYNVTAEEVCQKHGIARPNIVGPFVFSAQLRKEKMAKRQRVYQRGKEYKVIGAGKRQRRVVFRGWLRMDGEQESLVLRPVRKMRKHRT